MKTNKTSLAVLFTTAALAVGVMSVQAQVSFAPATNYPVGRNPRCVTVADVNGDGKADLISANSGTNTLSLLTNDGSGGFTLTASPTVGNGPHQVVTADVNGDGRVDLISANGAANTMTVLTNNGSGSFGFCATLNVTNGSYLHSLVAADVNGDGRLDLISASYYVGPLSQFTLSVFTNSGSGGFVFASSPSVGYFPVFVTATDVNGDGQMDLISANSVADTLTVLTNNGHGDFTIASSPGVGRNPRSVADADVNGDGRMDIVSVNAWDNNLTVLTNNGSGGFATASSPAVGNNPTTVVAADVNGDGKVDMISANYGANTLSVVTNNGQGFFATAITPTVGNYVHWVVAAEVNDDEKVDLISANYGADTLSVLINTSASATTLTNLLVTPASLLIAAGSNATFSATGYYNDGSVSALNPTNGLVWSSSNPAVATINSNGVATGLSEGSTLITASVGAISNSTTLTVVAVPTITTQPVSATISPGGTAVLSVSATGGNLSYQWQCNGTNIDGATGTTLSITNFSAANLGGYTVVVSNAAGSVSSQTATLATVEIKMFAGVIVNGPLGSNYVIEATTNMSGSWTTLTNVALPSQPYIYIDYASPTNARQFYRAVPQ